MSANPEVDREAKAYLAAITDSIEKWANGGIDGANIKDGSLGLVDLAAEAWKDWTPAWLGSVSNPNVAQTNSGRYVQIGKTVIAHGSVSSNGAGGGSYGSGGYSLSLPVTARGTGEVGHAYAFDSSAGGVWPAAA